MARSQNGLSAPITPVKRSIPGGTVPLRAGPVGDLLAWFAGQWHARVEPLKWPGCWGYAYRPIRGKTTELSNHCVTGDTLVTTYDGDVPIADLAGTVASVLARDPACSSERGKWVDAPVSHYGTASTYRVVLSRGQVKREVRATAEHRWFVEHRTSRYVGDYRSEYHVAKRETVTTDLQVGDRLATCLPGALGFARLTPSPHGVMHGVVFGDGTIQPSGSRAGDTAKVTLWNEKRDLLEWFPSQCPTSPRARDTGAAGVEVRSLPNTYKRLPSLTESSTYLAGWLAGYFAADGNVTSSEVTMSSRDEEALRFAAAVAARLGIAAREPRVQKISGGYKPGDQWSISFLRDTVPDWMIIREAHRAKLGDLRGHGRARGWKVESVDPTGEVEDVYCATVDGFGAFTLSGWLLTGNSSGSAIDLNAPAHPLGTQPRATLSQHQIDTIHAILREAQGTLRWGGDYTQRKDPMHVEVLASEAACAKALAAVRKAPAVVKRSTTPRTMYDSVTAAHIPTSAQMVAGYVSGKYRWSAADWARFPNAVKVRIATQASVNDGHVLDCEPGDATPAQCPGWVLMRRRAGVDPTIYCPEVGGWDEVRAAFKRAGVAEPHYWIARYNGVKTLYDGRAVAKQYLWDNHPFYSGGHYDISYVAPYWPGVDQATAMEDDMSKQDALDALREYFNTEWHEVPWHDGKVSLRNTILGNVEMPSWNAGAPDNIDPRVQPDYLRTLLYHLMLLKKQVVGLQAATGELAKDKGITAAELERVVNQAIAENVEITGTVQVSSAQQGGQQA